MQPDGTYLRRTPTESDPILGMQEQLMDMVIGAGASGAST